MTLIVVAQMYVADIIGKLSEKFYRIYPRKIRLLDIEHHVKIAAEAAFELVHKFRRLPVVMDDILLCEDYTLLARVRYKQSEAFGVFVRADIHRQLRAVEHNDFCAYRGGCGVVFFIKLPVIVEASHVLAE